MKFFNKKFKINKVSKIIKKLIHFFYLKFDKPFVISFLQFSGNFCECGNFSVIFDESFEVRHINEIDGRDFGCVRSLKLQIYQCVL